MRPEADEEIEAAMASEKKQGVELTEYFVVWKHKAMIMYLVSLSVASAALVSYVMKPTYEVSRILKIGQILEIDRMDQVRGIVTQEGRPIEAREALIEAIADQRLLEEVRARITPQVSIQQFVKRITVDRRGSPQTQPTAHVRYTVQGENPTQAVAVADAIAETIIQRHAKVFGEGMAVKRRYEEELEAKIEVLTREVHGMRKALDGMRANPRLDAPALILLLHANLVDRERGLADLNRELRDVRLSNLAPMSEITRVIAADAMPTKPVKPKTALNMALAGAASLFAGVSLAFVLEYWGRTARKRAEAERLAAS